MTKKMTKKMAMELVINAITNEDFSALKLSNDELVDNLEKIYNDYAKKKSTKVSKESADKKARILEVMSTDFMTAEDIANKTGIEGLSGRSVSALLKSYIDLGEVIKEDIVVENDEGKKSKKKGYKLAQ